MLTIIPNRHISQQILLSWYNENARPLPWRTGFPRDPYKTWLAEVIMQQTRISQGLPYYEAFIEAFPNFEDLAKSDEETVLKLWQGLGYYTRARNLLKAAKYAHQMYGNNIQLSYLQWQKLPGVGPYTAAALASLSNNEAYAVVDGNVMRVCSRYTGNDTPLNANEAKKVYAELATEWLYTSEPGKWNEAMMELGALICTPKNPNCAECPISNDCVANALQLQAELPKMNKKKAAEQREINYLIINPTAKTIILRKRIGTDIWKSLYDFPERIADKQEHKLWHTKHKLTHRQLSIHFYNAGKNSDYEHSDCITIPIADINKYPLPKPIVMFLKHQEG